MIVSHIIVFCVRYGLVVLFFPASALDKIINFDGAVAQAGDVFKVRPMAVAMIMTGTIVELVMPLGILTGIADRLAAFIMAGYCVVTALLFKKFWNRDNFLQAGESKTRDLFWDFLKNFSMASGFLLITVGMNGHGLSRFLNHPLASSHPYAAALLPQ